LGYDLRGVLDIVGMSVSFDMPPPFRPQNCCGLESLDMQLLVDNIHTSESAYRSARTVQSLTPSAKRGE
jgi:hypothetical protein